MSASKEDIVNRIKESKKILIGIGEEFSNKDISYQSSNVYQIFKEKKEKELEDDKVDWMIETIKNYYIHSEIGIDHLQTGQAYRELFNIIQDKDYFIVNMNTDGLLEKVGFNHEKIVYPCGRHNQYQCCNNCNNKVVDADEIDKEIIALICDKQVKLRDIKQPRCIQCGENLVYNSVQNSNYCEEGYLEQWKRYTEWTSLTLNQELCVLELGVNFKYPTVIRWPFEKIAFINNKAHFIRINEKFNQVSSELANKAITVKESAKAFLLR
ncbi:hypothetical protein [Candidatus Galacturonibacter soehngenii]|uniref:Deacetylase sirtuin-type domain-containing protein n=1 Tax=Candidatus Galacturonatibacter soehngenii TaxID=2307010 RepID=A0A7V7QN50_9FIRM|nr:hypothetical protein [Candidatus Galacturonibacter soehngenii]KAB1440184.1 hypothetical protein F7O84_07360 [Candidatus Galacturonibacter soehngenii]MBA4685971.1 hypothetical protein [Candidatus Galacturonibacter soehngenii]